MNKKCIQKGFATGVIVISLLLSATPVYALGIDIPNSPANDPNVNCGLSPSNNVDPCPASATPPPTEAGEKSYELPQEKLRKVLNQNATGLNSFDGRFHEEAATDPGADTLTSIVFIIIDFMKYLLGTIAMVIAVIQGLKLVTAGRKIDDIEPKAKVTLKLMIYGFIVIMLADELVKKVFFGEFGECYGSISNVKDCAGAGNTLIKGIYDFLLSLLATLSVFSIALAGFRMVTAAGNDDTIGSSKKRITFSVVGLIVAGVGEFVVKKVVFPDYGKNGVDYEAAQNLVISFTNYISSFIGAVAFIMLFYGGYLYAASFGDDDQVGKAKNVIKSALIGIIIAAAAFAIVSTITSFNPGKDTNLNVPLGAIVIQDGSVNPS